MKKYISAVFYLFVGLALCTTGFGWPLLTQTPEAGATHFKLPGGLYPFPITCEVPYTSRLPYIVQISGDYGSEQFLLNVSKTKRSNCGSAESFHGNTFAIVLDTSSGKELARLQPPQSIMDDAKDSDYIHVYIHAATPDLNVAVGSLLIRKDAGFGFIDKYQPALWEWQKDGSYKASLLPLPADHDPTVWATPITLSQDGLSINGNLYRYVMGAGSDPSHQIRWQRSSRDSLFQVDWGFQLERHYSDSDFEQVGENSEGDLVMVNEYARVAGEDNAPVSSHIIQYAQVGVAKFLQAIVLSGEGYGISPDRDFVLMRNGSNLIAYSMDLLQGQYLSLPYAREPEPVSREDRMISLMPDPLPSISRPRIDKFNLFNATAKSEIYQLSVNGTSPITKPVDTLDYLRNRCQLPGLDEWNYYDYLLPYFVKASGGLESYYLVYLSKNSTDYYRLTVNPSKCH